MPLQRRCNAVATPLQRRCNAAATLLQCHCSAAVVSTSKGKQKSKDLIRKNHHNIIIFKKQGM